MNKNQVIKQLQTKYPGTTIIATPENNPTEIICEVDPTTNHPEYSLAVAVIDQSTKHVHQHNTETYTVLKGKLKLLVDGNIHNLAEGDSFVIKPGQTHSAKGNETWVECKSEPGWVIEDHILI